MVKNIIVVGASAGGYGPITELVSQVPPNLPVAIFVVIHLSKTSSAEILKKHLETRTTYICRIPDDMEDIKAGHLYLPQPDYHMLIKPGIIRILKAARENRWRPSIDVLFRSAAAAYDSMVTGIILSGMMDDGTSGMTAIKRSGGVCIVQEPSEATYTDMPRNVINNVEVDHRVHVADISYILEDILSKTTERKVAPEEVVIEAAITEDMTTSISEMEKIGTDSIFTCPDCGGNLWQVKNEPVPRYRCHTGHAYTENVLLELQTEKLEDSLWVSIRMLEQRINLLNKMARESNGSALIRQSREQSSEELTAHVIQLKQLLVVLSRKDPE